jgi:three-Cys-motif partner protein
MADESFYDEPTPASLKKHQIVSKYFAGWANIILPRARDKEGQLWYVDLYSGPGKYKDGAESIPLLVARHAIATPALHDTLRLVFNDEKRSFTRELEQHLASLPGIDRLRHAPVIRNRSVGKDLIPSIQRIAFPTLFFADPWGYEGVSIDLVRAALTHWGSDFLFFFNYNRINMHLTSDLMHEPIDEFFSPERAATLRVAVGRRPGAREQIVVAEMESAIRDLSARTAKFTYRSTTGTRTTHHLVCVTRHREGLALFKEISAKESSTFEDDVPSLDHNPAADPTQGTLFSPLAQLEDDLVQEFAGRQLTTEQIYHQHHNGKPYVLRNYRQALLRLEDTGAIRVDPPRSRRKTPDSIPSTAIITFLEQRAG